jgi:hypothetical protein
MSTGKFQYMKAQTLMVCSFSRCYARHLANERIRTISDIFASTVKTK